MVYLFWAGQSVCPVSCLGPLRCVDHFVSQKLLGYLMGNFAQRGLSRMKAYVLKFAFELLWPIVQIHRRFLAQMQIAAALLKKTRLMSRPLAADANPSMVFS